MAMLQEMKVINLQLKVANNAILQEINNTFQEFGERLEKLEKEAFGEVQGEPIDIGGPSVDAMTLPTEQAEKDAALLQKIQESEESQEAVEVSEEGTALLSKSVPLGGPVGEPEEASEGDVPLSPTSMFPKA